MESGLLALWPLTWLLKGRPSLWTACAMWLVLTVASSAIWQPRQDRLICLHLAVPATETTWAQVLVSKGRVTELWEHELPPSPERNAAETVMRCAATCAPWQTGYHAGLEGSLTDLRLAGHLLSPHEIIYHKASLAPPLRSLTHPLPPATLPCWASSSHHRAQQPVPRGNTSLGRP